MSIQVTLDKTADVIKAIRLLASQRVMVGIPASDPLGTTTGTNIRQETKQITNAQLGYIHEHGAPGANIPARPFLIPGANSVKAEVIKRYKQLADIAFKGEYEKIDKALHGIGLIAQAAVRRKITDGPFVPLKPATIAARRRRYRSTPGSAQGTIRPLIDTGQLRAAIGYVIRKA